MGNSPKWFRKFENGKNIIKQSKKLCLVDLKNIFLNGSLTILNCFIHLPAMHDATPNLCNLLYAVK